MDHQDWIDIVERIGPRFAEGAEEREASDTFVAEHYPVLKESGLLTALVPADLGGGGASFSTIAAVLRRLAYYDGSTALALSMHQHLVAAQVFNHLNGRPAPLLPRVVDEGLVLVSTGARDWMESNGTCERVEGGYRLTARKAFASGSPVGSVAVTSAPFDHPEDGPQVLHFGVPLKAEGVSLENDWQVLGMRSTGSGTIVMKDVFVPEGSISLTRPRAGFAPVFNVVAQVAMPLISGVYLGVAERAAEIGLELAKKRRDDPVVQWSVGEMLSAVAVAQTCFEQLVRMANDLAFTPEVHNTSRVFMLKTQAVEQAKKAVDAAMDASGGAGFYRKNGLARLFGDIRAGHYHPLPEKQQLVFSGRLALGLEPIA